MMRPSQLTRLIWNYYRESNTESQQLKILENCKVNRRWGDFRVHCPNPETADAIAALMPLLELPILKLRLAKRIKVLVQGDLFHVATVGCQHLNPSDARKFLTNH